MAAIQIPVGFVPVVQGYGLKGPGGVRRTDVAGGMPRYGLQFDRGVSQFNVAMVMTESKFFVWSAFYHLIIKKGSITFSMPLDSGQGVQDHDCNIVPDSYTATRTDGRVTTVTFAVEAIPRVYDLSPADGQSVIDFWNAYQDDGSVLLARLAQFATVDLNVLRPAP